MVRRCGTQGACVCVTGAVLWWNLSKLQMNAAIEGASPLTHIVPCPLPLQMLGYLVSVAGFAMYSKLKMTVQRVRGTGKQRTKQKRS